MLKEPTWMQGSSRQARGAKPWEAAEPWEVQPGGARSASASTKVGARAGVGEELFIGSPQLEVDRRAGEGDPGAVGHRGLAAVPGDDGAGRGRELGLAGSVSGAPADDQLGAGLDGRMAPEAVKVGARAPSIVRGTRPQRCDRTEEGGAFELG
jgi:hypothetical protein